MVISIQSGVELPPLLVLLADGRLRSGEWLAPRLGVSRAGVWKAVERLRERGIDIKAFARQGYQLSSPVELLDRAAIETELQPERARRLRSLALCFDIDSTNTRLLSGAPPPLGVADVLISELQQAGRGRRGKQWISPLGSSLALSLGWTFDDMSRASPSLSLAVGVAVVHALRRAGAVGLQLKWPNDLWFRERKVGGVLLEMRAEASGPAFVVIGVGINVSLPPAARASIEAMGVQAASAADACAAPPSRNFIAGAIIDELLSMLVQFDQSGFTVFREAWTSLDALSGRQASVTADGKSIIGIACGVDSRGALLMECDGVVRDFVSGEASLRLV